MQKLIFEHKVSYCEVITSAMYSILPSKIRLLEQAPSSSSGPAPSSCDRGGSPGRFDATRGNQDEARDNGVRSRGEPSKLGASARKYSVPTALAGLILAYFFISARWIILYRGRGLFDIDESGYLMMAARNYNALLDGGLREWIFSIKSPSAASPLTSALASLLFLISGPRPAYGIFIPLFSFMTSIVAIYAIARRCGERLLAILTAIVVATTPLLVIYSRSFHFAMPATACTTLVLLCLIKSEQGVRWPWVIAFGVFVGLMPLARTMTVAFVPGLGVAALAYAAVAAPDERLKRVGRLAISGVVACVTSLTWLFFNGRYVADYLLSFGYGARAEEYGTKLPFASSIILQVRIFLEQTYAPHFVILLIGILLSFFLLLEKVAAPDLKKRALRSLGSPLSPVAIFALFSFLALASSQNKGTAFTAPILPAVILLSVWAILGLSRHWAYRSAVSCALCLASAYAFLPMIDLGSPAAARVVHLLPLFGRSIFAYGGGYQQMYEEALSVNTTNPGGELPPATVAGWEKLNVDTLDTVVPFLGKGREVVFGFRNSVYNVNTLGLVNNLRGQPALNFVQIEPMVVGDTEDGYAAWLQSSSAASACVLLTAPGGPSDIPPYINSSLIEAAAKQRGFTPTRTLKMPTERPVTIWTRPC